MSRTPEELPNEIVLCYPEDLEGDFLQVTEHVFTCLKHSSELPAKKGPIAIVE